MSRRAHCKLVTLAAFAAGLASCAPAPAPRHAAAAPAEASERASEQSCGGTGHDPHERTLEERSADLIKMIHAGAKTHCAPYVIASERYGEVRVEITRDGKVTAEPGPGMTDGDRQCLEMVAHTALETGERLADGRRLRGDIETRVVLVNGPAAVASPLETRWLEKLA